jgi:hypothetical protein
MTGSILLLEVRKSYLLPGRNTAIVVYCQQVQTTDNSAIPDGFFTLPDDYYALIVEYRAVILDAVQQFSNPVQ